VRPSPFLPAMIEIVRQLESLFREAEGLPPFRRDKSGEVEGWPAAIVAHLSEIISSLVHASTEELGEAIIEIEKTDKKRSPHGLVALLSRVAWDAPAAPDPVHFSRARQRGLAVRDAPFEQNENAPSAHTDE
jgi:hypothetical protein